MKRDNEETMSQIEQDAESEIKEILNKNQTALELVTDMSLRSKADLQITKNKLTDVQSDVKTLDRQILDRNISLEKQKDIIQKLNLDWTQKKAEIDIKDNTIHNREKDILRYKKKTQELEKFKFVLDEKIRDLRKDIAPKELEIKVLENKTRSMDKRLRKYNDVNASLGYMVEDLRLRQGVIQKSIETNRDIIRNNETYINNFKNAVYQVVQYTDDHQQLKIAVNQSLFNFIKDQKAKNGDINPNIKQEYETQRKFLENSMHSLKKRLEIEGQIHKADNILIMGNNLDLIWDIGLLRKNITRKDREKTDAENVYKQMCTKHGIKPARNLEDLEDPDWLKENSGVLRNVRNPVRNQDDEKLQYLRRELEGRRMQVENLRDELAAFEQEERQLEMFLQEQ